VSWRRWRTEREGRAELVLVRRSPLSSDSSQSPEKILTNLVASEDVEASVLRCFSLERSSDGNEGEGQCERIELEELARRGSHSFPSSSSPDVDLKDEFRAREKEIQISELVGT